MATNITAYSMVNWPLFHDKDIGELGYRDLDIWALGDWEDPFPISRFPDPQILIS
jgi:hypothetical protein